MAALALVGCDGAPPTALSPTRGYILISIDTLRADRLGCYGHHRDTSPFLDSLAEGGALFERAYVQLPGTLPSHMSIFTGLYPSEHGVFPPAGVLSPEIDTLPEVFRRAGFRTFGHTEGGYVHGGYGFAGGFEEFSHDAWKVESDFERTAARALESLRRLRESEPFFLFLHTYVVHDPYWPEPRYLERYWPGEAPETFPPTGPHLNAFNLGHRTLSSEGRDFFSASYDASINYADDILRGFFDELEAMGLADDVTVVLTSDHGEEFLEHGKLVHTQIYPETVHVPLIVLHPEITGPRRISAVVESIDIAPTLYRIAGLEPDAPVSGQSLVPWLAGEEPAEPPREEAFSEDRQVRSLIRADDGALHHLVLEQSSDEPHWFGRSAPLDTFASELDFEAKSFHEPRELRIESDGEPVATVKIEPEKWKRFRVALGESSGKKSVVIEGDSCSVPAEVIDSRDRRCLSFMLRGLSRMRLELYDLVEDPLAAHDLSARETQLVRRLMGRLDDYRLESRSQARARELDPELEERLRALGYLE